MRGVLLIATICFLSLLAELCPAQNPVISSRNERELTITVSVQDSLTKEFLPGAVVELISGKDTLRQIAGRAYLGTGLVNFVNMKLEDSLELTVSHLGYEPFRYRMKSPVTSMQVDVFLRPKAVDINSIVVIGEQIAVITKGDTTIYNAAAFKTIAGDDLVELFRQLPGMTVTNGALMFNGESIARIDVNGKQLFGNKVGDALRVLSSDEVEKVKVFDEPTEQTAMLRQKEGPTQKVVDVTTKKKYNYVKNRHIELAAGNSFDSKDGDKSKKKLNNVLGRYEFFSEKERFSASARHERNMGSLLGDNKKSSGSLYYNRPTGKYTSLETSNIFSLNDFSSSRTLLRDYFSSDSYGRKEYRSAIESRQKVLSLYTTNSYTKYFGKYGLSVNTVGNYGSEKNEGLNSSSTTVDGVDINRVYIARESESKPLSIRVSVGLSRLFEKPDRSLNMNASFRYAESDGNGNRVDSLASSSTKIWIDDFSNSYQREYSGVVSFKEPLSHVSSIDLSYSITYNDSKSRRISTDLLTSDMDIINSFDFTSNFLRNLLTARYVYYTQKMTLSAGLSFARKSEVRDESIPKSDRYPRIFNTISYNANLDCNFTPVKKMIINLSATPVDLSIEQLRGVLIDVDPVNLKVGNPDILMPLRFGVAANYSRVKSAKANSLTLKLSGNYIKDYITTKTYYFSEATYLPEYDYTTVAGANLQRWENVKSAYQGEFSFEYSKRLKTIRSTLTAGVGLSYEKMPYFLGNTLESNKVSTAELTLGFVSGFSTAINIRLSSTSGFGYNFTNTTQYLKENVVGEIRTLIGRKYMFNVKTLYNYYYNTTTKESEINSTVMDVTLGLKLTKDNRSEVSIACLDVFGQKTNKSTSINENYLQTAYANDLQTRCWLVKLVFKF